MKFLDKVILKILYDRQRDGEKPPIQKELLGERPDYNGLINKYMKDAGIYNDLEYQRPLKSAANLYAAISRLRSIDLVENKRSWGYRITKSGINFGKKLSNDIKSYKDKRK